LASVLSHCNQQAEMRERIKFLQKKSLKNVFTVVIIKLQEQVAQNFGLPMHKRFPFCEYILRIEKSGLYDIKELTFFQCNYQILKPNNKEQRRNIVYFVEE
jgi:hypothetical protein